MADPKVTITDVARKAGVSISTVSRVINNAVPVGDELRISVLAAVEELKYKPKVFDKGLRKNKSATIGVLTAGLSPFMIEVVKGVEQECSNRDRLLCLFSSENDPEKEVAHTEALIQTGVEGIIYVGAFGWEYEEHIIEACKKRIPIVVINREVTRCVVDQVSINKTRGNYLATNHLIRMGHTRIGCVAVLSYGGTGHEQLRGYHQAMDEAQIPVPEDLIIEVSPTLEGGYQAGKLLLQRDSPPSAIFIRSDDFAIGVMRAAYERGLRIPEDVSIVGFSDIPYSAYLNPPLTTICQPQSEMGVKAAQLLFERIENNKLPMRHMVIEPYLVVRRSTAEYNK